jgi:hypothetical protein
MKQERANQREIEGKQALFVVNLQPRKMCGIVSEGMLFDLGFADGILPVLAVPEDLPPAAPAPGSSRRTHVAAFGEKGSGPIFATLISCGCQLFNTSGRCSRTRLMLSTEE